VIGCIQPVTRVCKISKIQMSYMYKTIATNVRMSMITYNVHETGICLIKSIIVFNKAGVSLTATTILFL